MSKPRKSPSRPIRLPSFDSERCKECGICIHFCPKGALEMSEEGVPEVVDPEACNACRQCELMCPDFAVELRDLLQEDSDK
ncbi:MAG TPA: 4Fe-4S binding protein [Thermoleophilia bacterium]|nr:4Fe-4S binding protein [Thermoleophilia bacterium]